MNFPNGSFVLKYLSIGVSKFDCSIPKLLHPYFLECYDYIQSNIKSREKALDFLKMVKLKHKRLAWAFKQKKKGAKNKDLAFHLNIKIRRFQQLHAEYKRTGVVPKLDTNRRPKTFLNEEEKALILKAVKESKLRGAVSLRLYIKRYYGKLIPKNKLHDFLLENQISKEDYKKKKQRKYCRYERKHSFSLVHLDWHESKKIKNAQVCVVIDDASRKILAGEEFKSATSKNSIFLVKKAMTVAKNEYFAFIREVNTDQGSQFYATKHDKNGEKGLAEFEKFLEKEGINHIPSRRNHPQTNGKNERWFRTYEENRHLFDSFEEFIEWYNRRLHLGLSRKEAITPEERISQKLRTESLIGVFFKGN